MSAIEEPFLGLDTQLHITPTLDGETSVNTVVAEVSDLGALEIASKIVEFNSFGKEFTEKRVGQKDPGTTEFTLNWVPGNTRHRAIKTAGETKQRINLVVKWVDNDQNARAYFEAYVSKYGRETPIEDVVSCKVELAITGPIVFEDDTQV